MTLTNIFIAETSVSVGISAKYVGYPKRVTGVDATGISCDIQLGFIIVGYLSTAPAITLYAVTTYLFIKYGKKKMKMYVYIAISWAVFTMIWLVIGSRALTTTIVSNGFCFGIGGFGLTTIFIAIAIVGVSLTYCQHVLCGVLTCCLRRKVSGNTGTKKAITKILIFHAIKMFILLVEFISGALVTVLLPPPRSHADVIVFLVINYTFVDILNNVTFLLTPIISLIILKPLRDTLKELCKKIAMSLLQAEVSSRILPLRWHLRSKQVHFNNASYCIITNFKFTFSMPIIVTSKLKYLF